MPEKITQEIILHRFKKAFGNDYDYSKVVFIKEKKKVIIICIGQKSSKDNYLSP